MSNKARVIESGTNDLLWCDEHGRYEQFSSTTVNGVTTKRVSHRPMFYHRNKIARARDWLGGLLSKWADRLLYGDGHYLIVRDAAGDEIFSVSTTGGYVASHPPPPYTFECCDDMLDNVNNE